jgi:DNA mismatch repair ATPase MutS
VENFWFPLLNPYLQKASTLTFGSLEDKDQAEQLELQALLPPNVLLTGINGAGKTIVLKGIVWAIMMAKTFGYAPLTRGVMTFIDRMIVHLSSTDNAAEGESCWIAEAKAMGEAIHAMQAPRQGLEKILFIGDELGSGTADHASIAAVAQLIQIAVETPHVSTIITTHLRILTELERISNGRILNYCVGKRLLPDGSIEGRFQLQRGRAENNIAEKIVNDLLHKGKVDITDHSQPQEESFPVDDSEKSEQTEEVPV